MKYHDMIRNMHQIYDVVNTKMEHRGLRHMSPYNVSTVASHLVLASLHVPALENYGKFVRKIVTICTELDVNIGTIMLDRVFFFQPV